MNQEKNINIKVKPILRVLILAFSSIAILLTAGSCSIPGVTQRTNTSFGVLKKDNSIKSDGFGRINNVKGLDGNVISGGLASLNGVRLVSVNDSKLLYLTNKKGVFLTEDGGRVWERKYIFPIGSNKNDQKERDTDVKAKIATNDSFLATDVVVDINNSNKWLISGSLLGIGKIYKTEDNGQNFDEIYSEVENEVSVNLLTINPKDSNMIFGTLEGGSVIRSTDNGSSWKKLNNFNDTVVNIGFRSNNSDLIYLLLENDGLWISQNFGQDWALKKLGYKPSKTEGEEVDATDIFQFSSFEKIIPVNSQNQNQWLMIADKQLWFSENFDSPFEKLVLPLQNESYNILDVEADSEVGLNKIYASVNNKLFVTSNRGQSWSTSDMINLTSPIGNIAEIVIPNDKKENMYLMLVSPDATRSGGIF